MTLESKVAKRARPVRKSLPRHKIQSQVSENNDEEQARRLPSRLVRMGSRVEGEVDAKGAEPACRAGA